MALRATVKEAYELIKNYCETTDQYDNFIMQPWYPYLRLLRNPLSHDFIFNFKKYEKTLLPATWRGRTITAEMNGSPLRIHLVDDEAVYLLLEDMEKFIKTLE